MDLHLFLPSSFRAPAQSDITASTRAWGALCRCLKSSGTSGRNVGSAQMGNSAGEGRRPFLGDREILEGWLRPTSQGATRVAGGRVSRHGARQLVQANDDFAHCLPVEDLYSPLVSWVIPFTRWPWNLIHGRKIQL
jgi:hypothetical protein